MSKEGRIDGADSQDVLEAIASGDVFIGGEGFAGCLPDGRLVRDVLGRFPVFHQRDDPTTWAFNPYQLDAPTAVPAGSIVSEETTRKVWDLPDLPVCSDESVAITQLDETISERCDAISTDALALGYSGGVDSTLLAALLRVPRYTVGFPDTKDLVAVEQSNRDVYSHQLTHEQLERAIPHVRDAIGRSNAMDMAIGLSLYLLSKRVKRDGFDRLALGQGADELFAGYEKMAHLDHRVEAESVLDARREILYDLANGLERDVLAVRAADVEPVFPYLGDTVIEAGLRLDSKLLVRGETRKWALRQVAHRYLSPIEASRDKAAIQYGNGVATELDRLARQAGFKRRMPMHIEKYVESVS